MEWAWSFFSEYKLTNSQNKPQRPLLMMLKTTSIQRTCWHWPLDGMQSKITIVLLDLYLSSISVKITFKVFRPINRVLLFIFTRFESHDRVPQHRTRCAIIDYFLESVTSDCYDCSDNCGSQIKCQGLFFIPNVFAIILCCKWQILPIKAIKKSKSAIFQWKKNCNYVTRLSAFSL